MKQRGASQQPLSTWSPKSHMFFPEYSPVNEKAIYGFLSTWDEHMPKSQRQGEQWETGRKNNKGGNLSLTIHGAKFLERTSAG